MSIIYNQFRTVVLLGLLTAVFLWVGQLVGGISGLFFGLIFAVILNFGSYWFSDKIVLRLYGAKEVKGHEYAELYNLVKEVAHQGHLPMPKVYIIQSANPNAFATGRNPDHAALAFTTGILQLLSHRELKGVIAHEMSHVKNRDTLISTIAATIAGVITFVAMMARWAAIFGGFGGRDRNGSSGLELLVLAIVTPIVATIIQLAISRSREYLADATGAKMINNPHALADALGKLQTGIKQHPLRMGSATQSTAHLFIANPFNKKSFINLFSTHPPMDDRIKKLRNM